MLTTRVARLSLVGAALAVLSSSLFALSAARPVFAPSDARFEVEGDATRGKLIFDAGDCASCHASPGQSDRLHLGGGLALRAPGGTFRAPNISSDPNDGIGRWRPVDLGNALIAGVSPQRTHYYPAFPYTSFTGMKPEDVNDLMAYLRTLPAVQGRPPPHELSPMLRVRRAIGLWKLIFFREGRTDYQLTGDELRDRGAYLVESVAHCAECHSSRNAFGAIKASTRFAGAVDPEGAGFVPNITPERISQWSQSEIERLLISGETPDHGRVGSSMSDVVINTALLRQSDRAAMAAYIKSLPPRPTPKP